jgi:hypothetical protein
MKLLREYIRCLLEAQFGGLGVEQSIGYGKNYHTVNPQPITWENYPGLEYSIDADPDGKVYASITVTDYPEMSVKMRPFGDQNSAEFWVRSQYEDLHRKLMTIENSD